MKKFNLFIIAVLVLAMLVTLCACGGNNEEPVSTTTAGQGGEVEPTDTTTAGQGGEVEPTDTTTAGQGGDVEPTDTTTAATTTDPRLELYEPEGEGNFYDINDLIG